MNETTDHRLGVVPLDTGAVTLTLDGVPVVGETSELSVRFETRRRITLSRLTFGLVDEYWTADGVERRPLLAERLPDLAVDEGVAATATTTITLPETTAIGCGPTACTAVVSLSVDGETVSRSFGVTPLSNPKLTTVIEPMVDLGYTVCDSFLVEDPSQRDRSAIQSVRLSPTDSTPTTEPVDVFVRSVDRGLCVAPTVGRAPRTPVSDLPDAVLLTGDDGGERLTDAVERL